MRQVETLEPVSVEYSEYVPLTPGGVPAEPQPLVRQWLQAHGLAALSFSTAAIASAAGTPSVFP
jgi:hypothetical protein